MKASTNMTIKDAAFFAKNLGNLYIDRKEELSNAKIDEMFSSLEGKRRALGENTGKAAESMSLDKADSVCDRETRALFNYAEGMCYSPFEEEAENAQAVFDVLQEFGRGIVSEKFSVQYSKTDDMLHRLSQGKTADAVKAVRGMAERIEKVRQAAEDFSLLQKKMTQNAAAEKVKATYLIRKEIVSLVNNEILPYVSAMSVVESEKYQPFFEEINKEIKRVNLSLKQSAQTEQQGKA